MHVLLWTHLIPFILFQTSSGTLIETEMMDRNVNEMHVETPQEHQMCQGISNDQEHTNLHAS